MEDQISNYRGADILQHLLPDNSMFLADGGYESVWLRESAKGMTVCIPLRNTRKEVFPFDKTLYNHRHLRKYVQQAEGLAEYRDPL